MKKLNTWKLATLSILACLGVGIATFLIAQETETEDEQDCKWHVVNLQGEGSTSSHIVNAVQWNNCTGETYQLYRGALNLSTDPIQLRHIR
ncbi:MAG: hypothetical protein F4Z01_07000 [Gammaproteobacteria bacterium]|nr:hypothetical protein [Gammaproteobacteria bacterium]MYF38733.1 hypothetical protein [Gammaproteobacteria bacterium]